MKHDPDFQHAAIRKALLEREEQRTRESYLNQPGHEDEADDWPGAEPWDRNELIDAE